MTWEVSGADRTTGQDKKVIVDADNDASASRRAGRQGLMVADVRPLDSNDSAVGVHVGPTIHQPVKPAPAQVEEPLLVTGLHPVEAFLVPGLLCVVVVGFFMLPFAYLRYRFTTFTVTNHRITIKRGWLSRNTFEMLLVKVESIHVEQPILGRLLGTGTIVICGTGGSREVFAGIRGAQRFRSVATDAIAAR